MEKKTKLGKRVRKVLTKSMRLIGCAGVGAVGVAIDAPALFTIALAKSPVLLWKGCPWPLCIPAATTMLLLWPLQVAGSVSSALFYGFVKGINGAVVAYREKSIACGLKHVIATISEYDEYTNDVAALREGSCFPRPAYHCQQKSSDHSDHPEENDHQREDAAPTIQVIREFQMGKLVEYLTSKQARMRAKSMIKENVLSKPLVSVVSWTLLHFLLDASEKGPAAVDDPRGVVEYDALEILEYQIRVAKLQEVEEQYLESFILDDAELLQKLDKELDSIRRAAIEGFGRRIRGIASFVSANAEFRKPYRDYVRAVIAASQDMISFE